MIPIFFPIVRGSLSIQIEPPLRVCEGEEREAAVQRITTELAAIYTRVIAQHPEQWLTFFDFFGEGPR